ncbi:hypothetical protein SEA_IBANTIK_90 [Streptomyces phage Ibantik]|uniref:Uncharacterized protein n=1 Tax=Streptomyces phage Ibantik TaxID=2182397 RepID=A0A2U8UNV4_9CAUD|nr:hypothetical protein QEH36_gp075 [Streptomyces phage Ibantik]AWN05312.1 hypothetical protein SEA_IBANTIK_90 [Streptomyces phage Ibantik]
MNISKRFWEYRGTKQYVWHREINGTVYGFSRSYISNRVRVVRAEEGDWETVHNFSALTD